MTKPDSLFTSGIQMLCGFLLDLTLWPVIGGTIFQLTMLVKYLNKLGKADH